MSNLAEFFVCFVGFFLINQGGEGGVSLEIEYFFVKRNLIKY